MEEIMRQRSAKPTIDKRERVPILRKIRAAASEKDLEPRTVEDEVEEHDTDEVQEVDFDDRRKKTTGDDEHEEIRPGSGEQMDIIQKYLHEIGEVPLLTREEEVNLANTFSPYYLRKHRLESLKEARGELNQQKRLTRLDRKKMAETKKEINRHTVFIWQTEHSPRFAEVMSAKKKFVSANLRLVVSIAKRYTTNSNASFDLADLIQVGNLGLIKAVEKFEPKRGFRFSTYGTWWIRQTISRHLADCGNTVRLPVHTGEKVRRHRRITRELEQKAGKTLSHAELQEKLNMSDKSYNRIRVSANLGTTPLDAPINTEEGETPLMDFFFKDDMPRPDESHDHDSMVNEMHKVLAKLPEKERNILCHRFGISMPEYDIRIDREYSLDEIGKMHRVTRERIRQIQVKAMRRLAKKARRSPLKSFA